MSTARILIAARDPALVTKLQALVELLGYATAGVAAGTDDARRLAESLKPDLMLMDVRLEGEWKGIQTADGHPSAVADPRHFPRSIPRIFEALQKAKAIEPVGFIRTPLDDNEVLGNRQAGVRQAMD